jgi:hypothetical protein
MILDLPVIAALTPILILIGIVLALYGRDTLRILAFPIGAVAGAYLAYMIFKGMLKPYEVPLLIQFIASLVIVFIGGLLGKGVMAMLLAMFTSLVVVDILDPFLVPFIESNITSETEIVMAVIAMLVFMLLVPFVQKFIKVFSAIAGGAIIALSLNPFLDSLDEPVVRIIQLFVIIAVAVPGSILQYKIFKYVDQKGEEIVWIPSTESDS